MDSDMERGREIFFNSTTAACKNCHRIGEAGTPVGPDLTEIGKKYTRDQLLVHILEPSKFMEPKYVPYLLETTDGRVLSGLVEKEDDSQVQLRNAKNELVEVAREDVELLVRQHKSLMPDLLLKDMTAQEVADLLAFLSSLK